MNPNIITIEAVGNLLLYYRSDLVYIRSFQDCKLYSTDHLTSFRDITLPKFLTEYRVARAIKRGRQKDFFEAVIAHINTDQADNVDHLAKNLNDSEITQSGKRMVSLASKILFLNNPWKLLPYDKLVRTAIGYPGTTYAGYFEAVQKSKERILKLYHSLPNSILECLQMIEAEVVPSIPRVDRIRKIRFIDKVLWTLGRNKMDMTDIDQQQILT